MAHEWKLLITTIVMGLLVGCYVGPEFNAWVFSDDYDCMCKDVPLINCASDSCNCKKGVCNCEKDKPSDDCILDTCECEKNAPSDDCVSGLCNCLNDILTDDCKENPEKKTAEEKASAKVSRNISEDEVKWADYSGSMELENGHFKVYECFWRNSPEEWVIYKRKNNRLYWYRFFK